MLLTAIALAGATAAPSARASEQSSSDEPRAVPAARGESEDGEHRLAWTYPRFRTWQYVAAAVVTAGNLYVEFGPMPSMERNWVNGYAFDNALRDALRADTEEGRDRADNISDVMWYATLYYTVAIDSLLVPLAFDRGNTDVAFQMVLVDWQTIGIAGILTRAAHFAIGRARPSLKECENPPDEDSVCDAGGASFFSGHTSMAAAGAGLACAHHAALPLYGHGPWGPLTCGALFASATSIGVMRVMADKHWSTDVLAGLFLGGVLGVSVPWLLHYQYATPLAKVTPRGSAWIPEATPDGVRLSLVGLF